MSSSPSDITQLLVAASAGDGDALGRMMPLVYRELHEIAGRALRSEKPDHTLQATALVHEAYVRLIDQSRVQWKNRAHFFGVAASMMRRILVDHARAQKAAKRGGGRVAAPLDDAAQASPDAPVDLPSLDEALTRLAAFAPDESRIVELRFFGGLSVEDAAEVMGVSPATVKRGWAAARAWLARELDGA